PPPTRTPPAPGTRRAGDCERTRCNRPPRAAPPPPGSAPSPPPQPTRQRLADEFRPVVAPDATRRPAPSDHPGHDPPDLGPRHRRGRMQDQALPSRFVHQRQPLERAAIGRPVVDEVAGPDIVLEPGRSLGATVCARPGL